MTIHPDDRTTALSALDCERIELDQVQLDATDRVTASALIAEAESRLSALVDDLGDWLGFVEAHRGDFSAPTRTALIAVAG